MMSRTHWRNNGVPRRYTQGKEPSTGELSVAIGHLPVDSFFESATVYAFLIAVLFLFVYWRYDAASLSVCIFPLVLVLTQVGATESPISRTG